MDEIDGTHYDSTDDAFTIIAFGIAGGFALLAVAAVIGALLVVLAQL